MTSKTYVVAGSGLSLTRVRSGQVLTSDQIIRTNNFFFEPLAYLGKRVDMAFMGGDPRIAPFMFETLWRIRADYDLRAWTSHNPKVIRAGQRRFGPLYQPMRYRDAAIETEVATLMAHHDRKPTTGLYAVLMAHAMGAERIILAGIDFYNGAQRYPFEPGRHYKDLMGQDLNTRGMDHHLHDPALDLAILEALLRRGDVELSCIAKGSLLDTLMPCALLRPGDPVVQTPRTPPTDWVARAGIYPIAWLKLLRRASAWRRQLGKDRPQ
ncbi:hypothetical protein DS909_22050 [Phaeobacter gallaeciensis]|uniref:Alpha-2,3-sialyltransferase n=2 Tax=Roseobacteraceae TaxID=2854170 RepID=A0A366WKH0_9RHOB|nr:MULTISPECIES: alpha-2,3-sialyltransferase [Roseobacteraceae]MBT3141766.1 hypothetical protein [Falsiruegeria litorea]MBT8167142.1 hypothetical protein [Falsiruegeria litorea]RBW50304.1 hypothetical protein DS909_22050 [Phaeobacter gallaeciensis]